VDCNELVELVTAFLDGTLDPETEARVVEHLAICEGCERYLDQFRITIRELGKLPPETLSTQARNNLLDAFRGWHIR
jgi:predicted anti-sigma-YlaC factor YlaD